MQDQLAIDFDKQISSETQLFTLNFILRLLFIPIVLVLTTMLVLLQLPIKVISLALISA